MPKQVKVTVPDGSILDQHLRARPDCHLATEVLMLANTMATLLQLGGGLGIQGLLAMQKIGSANDAAVSTSPATSSAPVGSSEQQKVPVESPVVANFMDAALNFTPSQKD